MEYQKKKYKVHQGLKRDTWALQSLCKLLFLKVVVAHLYLCYYVSVIPDLCMGVCVYKAHGITYMVKLLFFFQKETIDTPPWGNMKINFSQDQVIYQFLSRKFHLLYKLTCLLVAGYLISRINSFISVSNASIMRKSDQNFQFSKERCL